MRGKEVLVVDPKSSRPSGWLRAYISRNLRLRARQMAQGPVTVEKEYRKKEKREDE